MVHFTETAMPQEAFDIGTLPITRSLEDYRHEQLLTIAEFAARLGMTDQTYRRLLKDPQSVRMPTKRKALQVLGVSPYHVKEFYPPTPVAVLDRARAAGRESDEIGWIAYDPDTLEPTGEVFDGAGNLLETTDLGADRL
jgi:transcriptional regulator with XRE-family HTH domain